MRAVTMPPFSRPICLLFHSARLMGDLKNADQSFAEYREKFAQVNSNPLKSFNTFDLQGL
jgi:hypothetical protein